MKILIAKYLTIGALIAFQAWFLWPVSERWSFEWEPLIGMILTFAGYLGIEAKEHAGSEKITTQNRSGTDKDRNLLEEFSDIFTPQVVTFFRDHDFRGTFHVSPMDRLFFYTDHWTTVEHEFIDKDLQKAQDEFREKAVKLARALAEYTTSSQGMATVKPAVHDGGPLPDWVKAQAKELNDLATEFVGAHQRFLRFARQHAG